MSLGWFMTSVKFPDELMNSTFNFKSSLTRHDVHVVHYVSIYSQIYDEVDQDWSDSTTLDHFHTKETFKTWSEASCAHKAASFKGFLSRFTEFISHKLHLVLETETVDTEKKASEFNRMQEQSQAAESTASQETVMWLNSLTLRNRIMFSKCWTTPLKRHHQS